MSEFFVYLLLSAVIGGLPLWPLLLSVKGTIFSNETKLTFKDLLVEWGFELAVLAVLLEFCKGLVVTLIALNFWESWQGVALFGLAVAMICQRFMYRKFSVHGLAIFCGAMFIVSSSGFKLFSAIWLSMLILLRSHFRAAVAGLVTLTVFTVVSSFPDYTVVFCLGFTLVYMLTGIRKSGCQLFPKI